MSNNSNITNLSDRFHKPVSQERLDLIKQQKPSEVPDIITEEEHVAHVAKTLVELGNDFNQSNTKQSNVTKIQSTITGYERGLALIQPSLFPVPEAYEGQHKESTGLLEERERLINFYGLEINDDPVPAEISTLAIIGRDLLNSEQIQKQLTPEEKRFLDDVNLAYKNNDLDLNYPYSILVLFQLEEELQNIREDILSGQLSATTKNVEERLGSMFEMMRAIDPQETEIERDLLKLYQDVSFLAKTNPQNEALWYTSILQQPTFSIDEPYEYLDACGIPDVGPNMALCALIIDKIDREYKLPSHGAFKHYAENSLGAVKKFVEYCPNAHPDLVTYALIEDLMVDETTNSEELDKPFLELISNILTKEQLEQFKYWKQSSKNVGARFSKSPEDTQDQLEIFYACKNLMKLYKYNAHLSLPAEQHPLIGEDIFDAEQAVTEICPDIVEDGYLNIEIGVIGEKVQEKLEALKIAGFEGVPPIEQYEESTNEDMKKTPALVEPINMSELISKPRDTMTNSEYILWIQQQHQAMLDGSYEKTSIKNSMNAYDRALILMQPFKFPIPEEYAGQYQTNLIELEKKYNLLNAYSPDIAPEMITLAIIDTDITDKGEIRSLLNKEEALYLDSTQFTEKEGFVDITHDHIPLVMHRLLDEMGIYERGLLDGSITYGRKLEERLDTISFMIAEMDYDASYLGTDLFVSLQSLQTLTTLNKTHPALWYLDVLHDKGFSLIESIDVLEKCGIPTTEDSVHAFDYAIANITNEFSRNPHESFQQYARQELAFARAFLKYCPSPSQDIITYALVEGLLIDTNANGIVDVTAQDELKNIILPEKLEQFKEWKKLEATNNYDFSGYNQHLQQQLEIFLACKDLVNLYECDAAFQLDEFRCPLIRREMYTAETILKKDIIPSSINKELNQSITAIRTKVTERFTALKKDGFIPITPPEDDMEDGIDAMINDIELPKDDGASSNQQKTGKVIPLFTPK